MMDRVSDSPGERVRLTDRISIGVLTRLVPRDLVDEVIAESGRREKRSRLLPAHVVVYYVLALALFFGEAYEEVMRRLVGGLRFLKNWERVWKVPTTSAISQARARLGAAPMEALFRRVAVPIARPGSRGAWFRSWRVMAIDGVILDVPDTPENNAEFAHSTGGKGPSAFPVVRVVGLGECGTHGIVSAALGTWSPGEQTLVPQLLPEVDPDMLILMDRGFYSYKLFQAITERGAAVVFRATAQLVLPVLEVYPDGSYRSVLLDSATSSAVRKRAKRAGDKAHDVLVAAGMACRVVEYMIPNRGGDTETFCLITSILDYQDAPSYELAALYHERWEFETLLDEIEIHQLGHGRVLR